MTGAFVTGIGWLTAGGPGLGRQDRAFSLEDRPLPKVRREDVFTEANLRFGRVSEYARLGLAAVALALRDAGLEAWEAKRPIGIVASTRLGCLETDIEFYETVLPAGGGLARPSLFAYTLPNCFTGEAAIQFGLTGPTIVAYDAAGDALAGVRLGLECLSADDCDALLAGHLDLPASPALPGIEAVMPGAVFLVLEKHPARALPRYGRLDLSAGGIHHEGVVLTDVVELVRACRKTLES